VVQHYDALYDDLATQRSELVSAADEEDAEHWNEEQGPASRELDALNRNIRKANLMKLLGQALMDRA